MIQFQATKLNQRSLLLKTVFNNLYVLMGYIFIIFTTFIRIKWEAMLLKSKNAGDLVYRGFSIKRTL